MTIHPGEVVLVNADVPSWPGLMPGRVIRGAEAPFDYRVRLLNVGRTYSFYARELIRIDSPPSPSGTGST